MRKLIWFAAGFGGACLLCSLGRGGLPALCAAVLLLCAALLLWLRTRPEGKTSPRFLPTRRGRLYQAARRLTVLCVGGLVAFGWFAGWSALFVRPAEAMADTTVTLSATVVTYPEDTSIGGCSLTLRADGGPTAPDILLYADAGWSGLKPGDRVRCTLRLEAADRLYGDETSYYTARGIFLLGYCDDPPEAVILPSVPLRYLPALCARTLREGIYTAFDGVAAPLAAAVTLGDKSGLSGELYSALSRSGVTHAAVVSGLHISFLVSAVMLLFGGSRKAALTMLPLLLFYALMAGGTPSALRAVVMQSALLAGPVLGREPDPPSSLGLALLVLLIQNPYAAASVSLQLSFAAVAGLLAVAEPLNDALLRPLLKRGTLPRPVMGLCRTVAASLSVTLGAMLFTTPLIALYFGRISLAAPLANLLVLWAVTLLMVAALILGTAAVFFPLPAAWLGRIGGLPAHYIHWVVSAVGRRPLAALPVGTPVFLLWLGVVYLHLPVWFTAKGRWKRILLSAVCLALVLGSAVGLTVLYASRADLTVTALDVGQGASTLFLSGGKSVLVDCGGSSADSAGDIAADRLASAGLSRLDLLVLTHLDRDHCNGVEQLLRRVEVKAIALPDVEGGDLIADLAAEEGAALYLTTDRLTFPFGKACLTLYPPLGSGTSNEEGLFALCSAGDFDVLITGDADAFVERMLVKYYPLPPVEVLMTGHHGSHHSTSELLLDTLRPELAVISVGWNPYGHPSSEVLKRLEDRNIRILRTDEKGAVTIRLKDGMISVQ